MRRAVLLSALLIASACSRRAATTSTEPPPINKPPAKRELSLCAPAAPEPLNSALLYYQGADSKDCTLERLDRREGQSGALRSAEVYERKADGVVEVVTVLPTGTRRLDQRYKRDAAGNVIWHERIRNDEVQQRTERTYDASGHMLSERRTNASGVTETEQRFDGAGRITFRRVGNGKYKSELSWRYDDAGRLLEAIERDATQTLQRSLWTYDDAGRPATLERYVKGELSTRQSWSWSAPLEGKTPQLTARTAEVFPPSVYYSSTLLDNYQPRGAWHYYYGAYVTPWFENLPGSDGSCTPLRTTYGLDAADEYALVFQRGENGTLASLRDKNGQGTWFDGSASGLGYAGYGLPYDYYVPPQPVIYGHLGAGRPWTTILHSGTTKMVERFDSSGRMIGQTVNVTENAGDPERERSVRHERERTFEGALLRSDRVVLFSGEVDQITRTLRFEHDASGRVLRRELFDGSDGAEKLIEWQSWQRDGSGRAVIYKTALQKDMWQVSEPSTVKDPPAFEAPSVSGTIERRFEGARLVSESERWNGQYGERDTTVSYDGERVLEIATVLRRPITSTGGRNDSTARLRFDADGRIIEEQREYSTIKDGAQTTMSSSRNDYEYNAFGLLTRQETQTRSSSTARHDIATYTFACAND
ncbi:MAG: hypothetical protein KC503_45955 [Myxococcales bacterium]|nr:hypothetical protein [Myxococcales bacterium]